MSVTQTRYTLIRRSFSAGFLVRGAVRQQVESFLFHRGLDYLPIREIKSLLGSEYLIEFYGSGDDARSFDLFLKQIEEQMVMLTMTVPMRRYKATRNRVDIYSASKTNKGVFRRKVELVLSVADARNLYYSLLQAEGQEAADLAEALRQGLLASGWGLTFPAERF